MSETELVVGTCECGCGEQVTPGKRFRKGHAIRMRNRNGHTVKKIGKEQKVKKIRPVATVNNSASAVIQKASSGFFAGIPSLVEVHTMIDGKKKEVEFLKGLASLMKQSGLK